MLFSIEYVNIIYTNENFDIQLLYKIHLYSISTQLI